MIDLDLTIMAVTFVAALYFRNLYASAYLATCLAHWLYSDYLSDTWYYWSAIMTDATFVMLPSLCCIKKSNRPIQACAFAFCITNCVGFALWYLYLSPSVYDVASTLIYMAIMAATIAGGRGFGRTGYDQGHMPSSLACRADTMLRKMVH